MNMIPFPFSFELRTTFLLCLFGVPGVFFCGEGRRGQLDVVCTIGAEQLMQLMIAKMTSEAPRRRNTFVGFCRPALSVGKGFVEQCLSGSLWSLQLSFVWFFMKDFRGRSLFCVKKIAINNWISMISSMTSIFSVQRLGGPNGIANFLEKISYWPPTPAVGSFPGLLGASTATLLCWKKTSNCPLVGEMVWRGHLRGLMWVAIIPIYGKQVFSYSNTII